MSKSNFLNFIDCAALKIYALPEAEIEVTNGTSSKTLSIDDVFEIEAGWKTYIIYIEQKQFGTWTIISTIGNTDRQKSIVINDFSLYTITLVLPNEYQPVEYLKSNADAYIRMSELTYNDCDGVDIDFQFNQQYSGNTIYSIFGGRYQDNSVMYGLVHYAGKLYAIPPDKGAVAQDTLRHRIKWGNKFNWYVIYDDTTIAIGADPGVRGTFCLDLFNGAFRNGSGGAYGGDYRSKSQIYHVNLYQGQEMIRNMWPCYRKSDYVAGMYDVIMDTFYTSNVSATFTFGAPIDKTNKPFFIYQSGFGAKVPLSYTNESNASINIDNFNITTNYNGDHYQILCFNTDPIDITKYGQLVVKSIITAAKTDSTTYDGRIFLANQAPPLSSVSSTHAAANIIRSTRINTGTEIQTTVLDLDDITTTGYVGLKGGMKGTISQIYLE